MRSVFACAVTLTAAVSIAMVPGTLAAADQIGLDWGTAQLVAGFATIDDGTVGESQVTAISCPAAGDCSAAGTFTGAADAPDAQAEAFVTGESGGSWSGAVEVSGLAALAGGESDEQASVTSISCGSPGNCTAAGDAMSFTPFLVNEVSGVWSGGMAVPGLAALNASQSSQVNSVSCWSAGNCVAVGWLDNPDAALEEPMLVTEAGGVWGGAEVMPGVDNLNGGKGGDLLSVSCDPSGGCSAGGWMPTANGNQAVEATEAAGTWTAQQLPGAAGLHGGGFTTIITSLSCTAAGECGATGLYATGSNSWAPFTADESAGAWQDAQPVDVSVADDTSPPDLLISCGSPGNCAVAGNPPGNGGPFVVDETDGSWGDVTSLPGTGVGRGAVTSLSCGPAVCVVGGNMGVLPTSSGVAMVDAEVDGTWGAAEQVPGNTAGGIVRAVSCAPDGGCALGGTTNPLAIVDDATPVMSPPPADSVTTLMLSAPSAGYASEQAETLSVTVAAKSPGAGTPTGSVSVAAGDTTICTIALDNTGAGSCTIPAAKLDAGGYNLVASYGGDSGFNASASDPSALTITREPTKATLTAMAKVTYGLEEAQQLPVVVTPQSAATPAAPGKVAIKIGTGTLCTITLTSGKGSCPQSPTALQTGSYSLIASYGGSTDFAPSAAAAKKVKVSPAKSTTKLKLSAATVTSGHEHAETISVTVAPQYFGTPTGTVKVSAGSVTLCTITLASAKGSCKLAAAKLRAGSYQVTAAYSADRNFTTSTSAAATLTVRS